MCEHEHSRGQKVHSVYWMQRIEAAAASKQAAMRDINNKNTETNGIAVGQAVSGLLLDRGALGHGHVHGWVERHGHSTGLHDGLRHHVGHGHGHGDRHGHGGGGDSCLLVLLIVLLEVSSLADEGAEAERETDRSELEAERKTKSVVR
jgi:hypothetical protein